MALDHFLEQAVSHQKIITLPIRAIVFSDHTDTPIILSHVCEYRSGQKKDSECAIMIANILETTVFPRKGKIVVYPLH